MRYPSFPQLKKVFFVLLFAASTYSGTSQSVGVGTNSPDSSAQLEVNSSNKGFLPPRVALTATNVAAPVNKPATGLIVYNTATAGGTPVNVSPGYYYWNGNVWVPIINRGNANGDMQYWDGTRWIMIPLGLNGQKLTICNGIPKWGDCSNTITISPANNPNESSYSDYYPNTPMGTGDTEYPIQAWTAGGLSLIQRVIVKYDLSGVPPGAIIDSAKLYLYAMPNPHGGNNVDAHYGSNNACWIQRILTPWNAPNPFTWNNPPAVTTTNQVAIPQSTSAFQNNVLDVTNLVRDMVTNGNNGWVMRLQSETIYNIRQYASSYYSDSSKRPKLVISYRY